MSAKNSGPIAFGEYILGVWIAGRGFIYIVHIHIGQMEYPSLCVHCINVSINVVEGPYLQKQSADTNKDTQQQSTNDWEPAFGRAVPGPEALTLEETKDAYELGEELGYLSYMIERFV